MTSLLCKSEVAGDDEEFPINEDILAAEEIDVDIETDDDIY